MVKVVASHESIRRQINDHIKNPFDAFNEYIWNAIDANSKNIDIIAETDSSRMIKLEIKDNGTGINHDDLEKELFKKFNVSQKNIESNHSLPHGNKGFGRFSFIKFAKEAVWNTIYHDGKLEKNFKYQININEKSLDDFSPSDPIETKEEVGTTVSFNLSMINNLNLIEKGNKDILEKFIHSICNEFAWIVELLDISIRINESPLEYDYLIEMCGDGIIEIEDFNFEYKFMKWFKPLHKQSSRIYYLNSSSEEVYVRTSGLNDKGDEFYHSIFVKGDYFNNFIEIESPYQDIFKNLKNEVKKILRKKRRPFIKKFSKRKVKEFEEQHLFPDFDNFEKQVKKPLFEEVVMEVIEFAPSLASSSNISQKRILLQLINNLLDDEQDRTTLYNILEVLVDEENKDLLKGLEETLTSYGLENLLGMIKLVEDRLNSIIFFKEMIYEDKFYFYESDLQEAIEKHFWIFGEEYHLMLGAEEDNFNKLRSNYYQKVLKIDEEEIKEIEGSKKQVDLFICGIMPEGRKNRNLIVEIKRPIVKLTKDHYRQIEDYKDIINKIPEFNSPDRNHWDYILLYTDISVESKGFFDNKIDDPISGLVEKKDNYNIFGICLASKA